MEDAAAHFHVRVDATLVLAEAVQALTQAVHGHGKLAVAHVTKQSHAHNLVEDDVDGLVHIFLDEPVEPGYVRPDGAPEVPIQPCSRYAAPDGNENANPVAPGDERSRRRPRADARTPARAAGRTTPDLRYTRR